MESEEEELERARKVMCNFGLFSGKTLGEMMENQKGQTQSDGWQPVITAATWKW